MATRKFPLSVRLQEGQGGEGAAALSDSAAADKSELRSHGDQVASGASGASNRGLFHPDLAALGASLV